MIFPRWKCGNFQFCTGDHRCTAPDFLQVVLLHFQSTNTSSQRSVQCPVSRVQASSLWSRYSQHVSANPNYHVDEWIVSELLFVVPVALSSLAPSLPLLAQCQWRYLATLRRCFPEGRREDYSRVVGYTPGFSQRNDRT